MIRDATSLDWSECSLFINPTTYGLDGYASIPWLLLFFDSVAVYGPVSCLIDQAFQAGGNNRRGFTRAEFREAIEGGEIVPVAFQTFIDPGSRRRWYPTEMQIADDFDRDLVDPRSPLGARLKTLDDRFKTDCSSAAAMEYIQDRSEVVVSLLQKREAFLRGSADSLRERYHKFLRGELGLPVPLQAHRLEEDQQLPAMVVYDLLNERLAMQATGSTVHFTSVVDAPILADVHGLTRVPVAIEGVTTERGTDPQSLCDPRQVLDEILVAIEEIRPLRGERLTLEFVRKFRTHYGRQFLRDMARIVRRGVETSDPDVRLEEVRRNVREFCASYAFHFSVGPMAVLKLFEVVNLGAVSDSLEVFLKGPSGSARRAVWDGLHTSIEPTGRWAYSLFHQRRIS